MEEVVCCTGDVRQRERASLGSFVPTLEAQSQSAAPAALSGCISPFLLKSCPPHAIARRSLSCMCSLCSTHIVCSACEASGSVLGVDVAILIQCPLEEKGGWAKATGCWTQVHNRDNKEWADTELGSLDLNSGSR